MLRLTGFELYKIWGKKLFWGVLAVLLFLNLFLLWYTADVRADFRPAAYRGLAADLQGSSEAEKMDFIEAAYEKAEDKAFFSEIRAEIQSVEGYYLLLDEIGSKAQNLSGISIFREDTGNHFSGRNIRKTAADFGEMREIEISYEPSKGFMTATSFFVTDILLLGALFIIGSILVFDEKKKDMFAVIRVTPGGRLKAMGAKIAAMGISALGVTVTLFAVNFIYCQAVFGIGSLERSLQSNAPFLGSILPLSVGQYLCLFLLLKWAGAFLAGLLILFIALLCGLPIFALLGISALYGSGFLLYVIIPPSSPINLFRYINPAIMLRTNTLFMQYLNFNLFGYPVNLIPVLGIFLLSAIISLLLGVLFIFKCKKNYRIGQLPAVFAKITLRLPMGYSLFSHEAYKLLIRNRALFFILLYGIVMYTGITAKPIYRSTSEIYYSSYMHSLSGDIDPQKQAYLKREQKKFKNAEKQINEIVKKKENGEISNQEASEMMSPYLKILDQQTIFQEVLKRITYVKYHEGAKLMYDTGYRKLLLSDADVSQALILILVFVLCFTSVFGAEFKNNAIKILRTTPLGREQTARVKLELTFWLTFVLGLMYLIPQIVLIGKSYGFSGLFYPAMSIPDYAFLPSWMPVILIVFFHFEIQVLTLAGLAVILCAISLKLEHGVFALLAGTMIFGTPILLTAMGLEFARIISILPFLEAGKNIPGSGREYNWFLLLLFLLITAACYYYLVRSFGNENKSKFLYR